MKKAFTLLEMVFVLVVVGILSAIVLTRPQSNSLQEAGLQLLSHIRYTQHLALVDNKFDTNDLNWFKKRWQLVFSSGAAANNSPAYTIFSDTAGNSTGNVNVTEVALNPENSTQYMSGGYSGANALDITSSSFNGMKKLNLGMSYGVSSVSLSGGCQNNRIAFDHIGRLIKGDQTTMLGAYSNNRLVQTDCFVSLTHKNGNILIITIRPETGYASITQY